MKIALLGGGNCYALNLARMALSLGHDVIGIGRSPLKGEAFTLGAERMGYRYWNYSIGPDTEFVMDLLDKEMPEVVVSFCAQGEGAASFKPAKHWKHFIKTNGYYLTDFVAHLSERDWLGRFIQVGTSELYGSVNAPTKEDAPTVPTSPYAASKAYFDMMLMSIARVLKFPAVVIRPSNAYCAGQQLHRVIPKAMLCGLSGAKIPLQGGGRARKSYLDADDLSRAILLLAEKGEIGEIYNCGPDEPISIHNLLVTCAEVLQMPFERLVEMAPDRVGQDGTYWLDSSKLKSLGWSQQVPLFMGVTKMRVWVEAHLDSLLQLPSEFRMRA